MRTQCLFRVLIALALMGGTSASAFTPTVEFTGDSTLHAFGGSATVGAVDWSPPSNDACRLAVVVDSTSMQTGNSARDANMQRLLDVLNFPRIAGWVDAIPAAWRTDAMSDQPLETEIHLTIRDQERRVPARLQPVATANGERALDVAFTISLQSFGLKPPSVIGLIRVRDEVKIHALLPLPAQGAPGP